MRQKKPKLPPGTITKGNKCPVTPRQDSGRASQPLPGLWCLGRYAGPRARTMRRREELIAALFRLCEASGDMHANTTLLGDFIDAGQRQLLCVGVRCRAVAPLTGNPLSQWGCAALPPGGDRRQLSVHGRNLHELARYQCTPIPRLPRRVT